jgi:hypothetical protein
MPKSGFIVDIQYPEWQKQHKDYSLMMLRMVWTSLPLLFTGPGKTIREYGPMKLTVHKFRGAGWLTLPVLPFAMIHESLHFIFGYFTENHHIITLVPPILDLVYLPLLFLWIPFHPNIYLFLAVSLWVEWCWILHLMSNLSGDFASYLPKLKKRQDSES